MFVNITKSTRQGKKMMAIFYDETKKKLKTTHFGAVGYNDYTITGDLQAKMNYLQRHEKREDWSDYMTPGSLSKHILWNKPTIKASIEDYLHRFKLKKY
jgi:L-rhamnose mutarotase